MGGLVTRMVPEDVSAEVAKYITALEDAVEGFDDAMTAFAAGNTSASVEAVYAGIRSAVSALVPEDLQHDETFSAVASALDTVVGELSSTMLKYQQQLLQSSVCWKQLTRREHTRPDQCPDDTKFDGKSWCSAAAAPSLLDASVQWKKEKSGSAPSCNEDSDYPTQKGSWCYKDCPSGLEPFHPLQIGLRGRLPSGLASPLWQDSGHCVRRSNGHDRQGRAHHHQHREAHRRVGRFERHRFRLC